ncbi:UNVERIFIED_CONTAM: hypothetical protein FKN15_001579 [Acipenser sinensis]
MRRKLMWNARQQWKLLGLFEIGKQHEFYEFTCMLKEGLAAAVQNSIDNPPPKVETPVPSRPKPQDHRAGTARETVSKLFNARRDVEIPAVARKRYAASDASL